MAPIPYRNNVIRSNYVLLLQILLAPIPYRNNVIKCSWKWLESKTAPIPYRNNVIIKDLQDGLDLLCSNSI